MSENHNRGLRDFAKYDEMTTEELEQILRLDAEAPEEQESDTELLLYVMGVLANRRKSTNNTGKTALEAWESFQQNYLSEAEEYPENMHKRPAGRAAAPWLRRLIAAAAVIVLVICIPVTANALGWEDIWNVIARWAKETFSFVSSDSEEVGEPDSTHRGEATSLQELLADSKRDAEIVPTWIPEGFELEKTEKDITPMQEVYRAFYLNDDKELKIQIQSYLQGDSEKIEINENLIEVYEANGTEYYLFSNMDQIRAAWIVDSYECYISGDLTVEEMKEMIDSIGKG